MDKSMSEGERLFRSKCRSCHVLPDRDKFSHEEWMDIFSDHRNRMNLESEEYDILLEFLIPSK